MFFVRYLEYLCLYLTLGLDKVSSPASQYVIAICWTIWSSPLSYANFKWTEDLLLLSFWSFFFVRLLRASPSADNGLCIHPTNIFAPALSQGWCWALHVLPSSLAVGCWGRRQRSWCQLRGSSAHSRRLKKIADLHKSRF